MNHNHIKFKGVQNKYEYNNIKTYGNNDETHYKGPSRRVLLLSSEDLGRMAVESSRARLMMELVSKPEETSQEFGSYLRGHKKESNPVDIMTSHTSAIPVPKRIVPAYPSLVQGLKWSSSISVYSEDNQTDTEEDNSYYTCRCQNCKMKLCLGRDLKIENKQRPLKDNIMKFSNNSTMTPKVTEIGCGACTPLNRMPITSKVSMATSEILVLNQSSVIPQSYPIIPILKNSDNRNNVCTNIETKIKPRITVTVPEAVKVTNKCIDSDDPFKSLQTQDPASPPSPNNSDNSTDCEYRRKVIYNEGIRNLKNKKTNPRYPVQMLPSLRLQSPIKLKRDLSKVSIMNKNFEKETIIPYGHRKHSKYHSDCKPTFTKTYRSEVEEANIHRAESPLVFRRTPMNKAIRCTRTPSIRLPKKVLTSERDIETFVGKTKSKK